MLCGGTGAPHNAQRSAYGGFGWPDRQIAAWTNGVPGRPGALATSSSLIGWAAAGAISSVSPFSISYLAGSTTSSTVGGEVRWVRPPSPSGDSGSASRSPALRADEPVGAGTGGTADVGDSTGTDTRGRLAGGQMAPAAIGSISDDSSDRSSESGQSAISSGGIVCSYAVAWGEITAADSPASTRTAPARTAPTTRGSPRLPTGPAPRSISIWSRSSSPTSRQVSMPAPSATTSAVLGSSSRTLPRTRERIPVGDQNRATRSGL